MAATIAIAIRANESDAVRGFNRVSDAAAKMSSPLTKVGASLSVFGGNLLTSAARSLAGLFKDGFEGAQEAARNMRVLNNQIANLDAAGKQAFAGASDFANDFGESIGRDDDDIRAVLSKLASFPDAFKKGTLGAEAMRRATEAAFDLQAIGIGDAQSNIIGIGKALNDPIKGMAALSRSGVSFTAEQKKQIENYVKQGKLADAQRVLLAGIESNAKGAALAAASPIEKMHVAFQNFLEGVATKLLPTFSKVADLVTTRLLPKLQQLVDWAGPKLADAMSKVQNSKVLNDLLDRLKTVDVDKLKDTAKNIIEIAGVFKIGAGLTKHPVLTLLGLLAARYPKETADVLNAATSALSGVIHFAAKNPDAVKSILLLLAAYKGLSAITGMKLPDLFANAAPVATAQAGAADVMLQAARLQDAAAATMLRAAGMQDAGAVAGGAGGAAAASGGIRVAAVGMMSRFSGYLLAAFNALSFVESFWEILHGKFSAFNFANLFTGGLLGNVTDTSGVILKAMGMDPASVDKIIAGFKTNMLGQLSTFFGTALPSAILGFLTNGIVTSGGWSTLGHTIIDGIITGVGEALSTINETVKGWVDAIVKGFKKWLGIASPSTVMAAIGTDIVNGLILGITTMWVTLIATVGQVKTKVLGALTGAPAWLIGVGASILQGLVSGIGSAWGSVTTAMSVAKSKVTAAMSGAIDWLRDKGADVVAGLRNGLSSAWNNFVGWWNGKVGSIPGGLGDSLKIHSPSLVMAWYGKMIIAGLAKGINDNVKLVDDALGNVRQLLNADSLSGGGASLDLALSGSGGASGSVVVNVNVPPTADPAEVGRQVVKAIKAHQTQVGRQFLAV